jgi:hypothetical protein
MVEIQPATISSRPDSSGEDCDNGVTIERREKYSAVCKWRIEQFSTKLKRTTRCLYSKYFEVGGFDCRLLVYPAGNFPKLSASFLSGTRTVVHSSDPCSTDVFFLANLRLQRTMWTICILVIIQQCVLGPVY